MKFIPDTEIGIRPSSTTDSHGVQQGTAGIYGLAYDLITTESLIRVIIVYNVIEYTETKLSRDRS